MFTFCALDASGLGAFVTRVALVQRSVSWCRVVIFLPLQWKLFRHNVFVQNNMRTYTLRKPPLTCNKYVYRFEETSILANVVPKQISPWPWKRNFHVAHVTLVRHVTCEYLKPGRLHVLGLSVHIRMLSQGMIFQVSGVVHITQRDVEMLTNASSIKQYIIF
jgi:hypothetical protein